MIYDRRYTEIKVSESKVSLQETESHTSVTKKEETDIQGRHNRFTDTGGTCNYRYRRQTNYRKAVDNTTGTGGRVNHTHKRQTELQRQE